MRLCEKFATQCVIGMFVLSIASWNHAAIAQQSPDRPAISESQSTIASQPNANDPVIPLQARPIGTVAVGLHELSPWSMFLSTSLMVQTIIAGLVFASLVTWTIFIAKFAELFIAKRRLAAALAASGDANTLGKALSALSSDRSVLRAFVATGVNELRASSGLDSDDGIKERVASSFSEITRAEARRIRFGMGVLATIAATSPFVGLFGTVWGIMNSFIGISKTQTTNLAVVAPGIAEALLATAVGLFAAIPAVMIYNHFSRVTKGYLELVNRAAGAAGRQLSRDLDRHRAAPMRRAAAE